jgi:hypothetical protein
MDMKNKSKHGKEVNKKKDKNVNKSHIKGGND